MIDIARDSIKVHRRQVIPAKVEAVLLKHKETVKVSVVGIAAAPEEGYGGAVQASHF
jgi:hypothetical protein